MAQIGAAMVALVLLLTVSVFKCRRRKSQASAERHERANIQQDRRQAHYMQNFWNYDGSEQEDFEG